MLVQCSRIWRQNLTHLLSLKWFEKYIVPVLHYDADICSVTNTNNCIHLNYNNGADTWYIVIGALRDVCGNEIPYAFARKVCKCPANSNTDNRRILVKSQYTADREYLRRERLDGNYIRTKGGIEMKNFTNISANDI